MQYIYHISPKQNKPTKITTTEAYQNTHKKYHQKKPQNSSCHVRQKPTHGAQTDLRDPFHSTGGRRGLI